MNTLTTTHINDWANQISRKVEGENETFYDSFKGYEVEVGYKCTIGEDKGDYWTAPSWWIETEEYEVLAVWNIETGEEEPEIKKQLEKRLN